MRILAAALLVASSSVAVAADAPPVPPKTALVRGTIQSLDAKSMTIKTDGGADFTAAVGLSTRFATVEKRSFSQIKPTDFVGITSVPGKNGHLNAEEIHIIPLAGLGEGQYPWEHHPAGAKTAAVGSMTNGTVMGENGHAMAARKPMMGGSMTNGTVAPGAGDRQLNVTYHGAGMVDGKCEGLAVPGKPGCTGTAIVDVTPATPIVAIVPYRHDLVKPGVYVVAQVLTDAAGKASVVSATVEKNGVKPEF
ncbi:MAG: hypothetical protein JSR55_07960 [Proteobacteria bacterium]|nr:hypothetical protein [Pseudomonadota bacterium]